MECSDARHFIHLDVGNDLRVNEETQLAEHMGQCGDCRNYHAGMSQAMNVLVTLRDAPVRDQEESSAGRSVWPAVSREIQRRRAVPVKMTKFNLQVAALSVCSLSLAVVTIVQSLSSMRGTGHESEFMPAQSVSTPVNMQHFAFPESPGSTASRDQLLPVLQPSETAGPQSF